MEVFIPERFEELDERQVLQAMCLPNGRNCTGRTVTSKVKYKMNSLQHLSHSSWKGPGRSLYVLGSKGPLKSSIPPLENPWEGQSRKPKQHVATTASSLLPFELSNAWG